MINYITRSRFLLTIRGHTERTSDIREHAILISSQVAKALAATVSRHVGVLAILILRSPDSRPSSAK